ncbi:MAG: TetR/AcrR family transcriptional regulator [Actinomycetes bacterium]
MGTAPASDPPPRSAPADELGRRARKKQATRDSLRNAALELMADRSFTEVTVEDICERADVAPSTFFRHFPTKEDVVLTDLADRGEALVVAVDTISAGLSPSEFVRAAALTWEASRMPSDRLRAEAVLVRREPALRAHLDQLLTAWEAPLADRLADRFDCDRDDLAPRLGAACMFSAIRVVVREWAQVGQGEVVDFAGGAVRALGALFDELYAPGGSGG